MENKKIVLFALLLLTALMLAAATLSAQDTKGVRPTHHSSLITHHSTRAVVVGISDYQDPAIPDLQYAHRDAEAFAEWLSRGLGTGGALPANSVKTLLNEQATTGKIIAALDGLISASKTGDVAIIYFSGHGDVERVTKFQRGYWLTYDSPPAVYAAGAFSLVFLQDIITTLAEAGVQVVVVSDACRAGKLAGSEYGGAQATTAALSKQFANEIKILSCQPNEFSLEGEQWGGGRGAFTYHLLDALYGMADQDVDDRITVKELNRYLEDHVAAETAPHRQNPLVLGDREMRLATVIPEALAQWRQQKTGDALALKKIDPRGFEDLMLAGADSSIRAMYAAFTAALEQGDLMPTDSTAGKSANDYYELLIKEPSLVDLHGLMTRNFAAALIDEGQQVINRLLKTDLATVSDIATNPIKFDHIPDFLHRAAELVGVRHYLYKSLKAKEFYFLEKKMRRENYSDLSLDSIRYRKLDLLRQGLAFDSTAAYLWESHRWVYQDSPELGRYIQKALEYSPNWALAHFELAVWYSFFGLDLATAVRHYEKCIELAPDFAFAYIGIGSSLELLGETEQANQYFTFYVDMIRERLEKDSADVSTLELKDMGNVLWGLRHYREAIEVSNKVIRMTGGNYSKPFGNLLGALADLGKFEEYLTTFEKCCMETYSHWMPINGDFCFHYLHDSARAEYWYEKAAKVSYAFKPLDQGLANVAIARFYRQTGRPKQALNLLFSLDDSHLYYLFAKGEILRLSGKQQEARRIFDTIATHAKPVYVKNNKFNVPFGAPDYVYQTIAFHRLEQQEAFEAGIQRAMKQPDGWRHFWLACIYAQTDQPET